ncbi:MAG: glycosyltransferase family 39 protein [Elusimicrobiales bacterium]|nr:glycosyltransferase family 39 protein [Elusimicrobiales bacterium]
MNISIKLTREKTLLLLILFLALLLRAAWLDWGLPNRFRTSTLNCDEATALTCLQAMDPASLDFNPVSEKHPNALVEGTFNLYTYAAVLKAASYARLLVLVPDKDFYYDNPREMGKLYLAGKLLSVFYGLLTVAAVFVLAKKMFGPGAALTAALLTAMLPAHVVYSRYLLMNVPGLFWIVFSFIFLKNVMDGGRTRDYALAGLGFGLAAATRFSGAPLAIMLLPAHFMGPSRRGGIKKLLIAASVAFLAYATGAPYTFLDFPNFINGMRLLNYIASTGVSLSFSAKISFLAGSMTEAMGLPLLLAGLAGVVFAAARGKKNEALLLIWIALMTVFFLRAGQNALPGRILPAIPFIIILAAAALARMRAAWPRLAAAALLLTTLHLSVFNAAYLNLLSRRDIRDSASQWIEANIPAGSSFGLVREPSWSTPGLIDRKYRHPDHARLPDHSYVSLTAGEWASFAGYDLLARIRPDYVVFSSVEESQLPDRGLYRALEEAGYEEAAVFTSEFSLFGLGLSEKIPGMFYIPDHIKVFRKKSLSAE